MTSIKELLSDLRNYLTQDEIAQHICVHRSRISRWSNGLNAEAPDAALRLQQLHREIINKTKKGSKA